MAVPLPWPLGEPGAHDGTIVSEDTNLMWETDAANVVTFYDGLVWVLTAIKHWNAEGVGLHVSKYGACMRLWRPSARV